MTDETRRSPAETVSHDAPVRDGNLYREYPDEFMQRWHGCTRRGCLMQCDTSNGHCERLRIEFEAWAKRVPTIKQQLSAYQRPEGE